MSQPDYHVPSTVKKPRRGSIILFILNILNSGFFSIGFVSLLIGACGVDRDGICRGMWFIALLVSGGFSILLLATGIGLIYFDKMSKPMRWFNLGLPLIQILIVAFVYLPALF